MIKAFLALVYPRKCIVCRRLLEKSEGEYVCRLCLDRFHGEKSQLLGEEQILREHNLEDLEDLDEAFSLLKDRPDQTVALFPYTGDYRKSILRWKYKGVRKYARAFAYLLVKEQKVFEKVRVDALIPVPLAPSRMRKRGFNQALDLAREIENLTNIPVWDCLKRVRDTKPQADCSKEARYKNVEGSMAFLPKKSDQEVSCIVLIDDIYTTGSTIKECIKTLRQHAIFKDTQIKVVVVGKGDF